MEREDLDQKNKRAKLDIILEKRRKKIVELEDQLTQVNQQKEQIQTDSQKTIEDQ
jgi:hypothetical protein